MQKKQDERERSRERERRARGKRKYGQAKLKHAKKGILSCGIAALTFLSVVGSLIATLNHTVLIIGVLSASKKAENQDVKGGQAAIQMSYMGRLLGLFLILVLCAKSGVFNLLALVIPLLFARPLLTVSDHFNQKKGGTNL